MTEEATANAVGSGAPGAAPALEDDFPISWPDPDDGDLTWEIDDMHMPFPLAPLAADYVLTLSSGFNAAYEDFDSPMRVHGHVFHGYCYIAANYGVPDAEVKDMLGRLRARYRAFARDNARYWNDEALPELQRLYAGITAIDVDGLAGPELAGAWEAAWNATGRAWSIHFVAIRGAYRASEDLADLYETAVPNPPPGEALALIQGGSDVLQEVEAGIERLSAMAAVNAAVAARLAHAPMPALDELADGEGDRGFVDALGQFLEEHGHLGQSFDDLALASWAEDPPLLLAEIAKRIEHPAASSAERRAHLRAEAQRLAAAVRSKLTDRPDELARFEDQLALAREVGPLTEIHNYWIDRMAQARIRALAMRVGRRLAREGSIAAPEDVLYLHRDEIAETLRSPRDRSGLVAERQAEHARQRTLKPPPVLGRRDDPAAGMASRFDVPHAESGAIDELRGTGASAGVVRGPARVALGPDDFGRIQSGDIIVCPSSNPSWVPVFAIAGGLVTNTGGVLAHAAVVAREFGLPAVVGVAGATTKIADGRTIEIDGTQGTVRLL